MSSLCRASLLALVLLTVACDREDRDLRGQPLLAKSAAVPVALLSHDDDRANYIKNNAYSVSQGQLYFRWMNCNGCHANGGGGMGPALMDDEWRYGKSMGAIVASIAQGRPNGMPSFAGKLTPQQMWEIAAYVRTMSATDRQDVRAGRAEGLSAGEPPSLRDPQTPKAVTPEMDQATAR